MFLVRFLLISFISMLPFSLWGKCNPSKGVWKGSVVSDALNELSGLAYSKIHHDTMWGHNDSGASSILFALGIDGSSKGRYRIPEARNIDWEDIDVGTCPSGLGSCIYIGDMGNNGYNRTHLTVYVVKEPEVLNPQQLTNLPLLHKWTVAMGEYSQDFEALVFSEKLQKVLFFSKTDQDSGETVVSRIYAMPLATGGVLEVLGMINFEMMQGVGHLPAWLHLVTAADLSPDQSTLLIGTYGYAMEFPMDAVGGGAFVELISHQYIKIPMQPQVEAITYNLDGSKIYSSSEFAHQPIFEINCIP